MPLTELGDPKALQYFLQQNPVCIVTFSAHWCGPCRSSKPQLEALASTSPVPFGYVYESDIGDFLHTFAIRAFPTYVLFQAGNEASRVEGVNFGAIEEMIKKHGGPKLPQTGGNALCGGESKNLSPEEARQLRLAKFAAPAPAAEEDSKPAPMDTSAPTEKPPAEDKKEDEAMKDADDKKEEDAKKEEGGDETMKDAEGSADEINPEALKTLMSLDPEALKTLTESMGFSMLRAQKGLLFSEVNTVEGAINWLMEHQDDDDIDEPIPESALLKKKLTPEEKAAKILELKKIMKEKRAAREESEKVDHVEREKQRRFMGKEMIKTA